MSNQEKKNSLFQPVGKAQAMTGTNGAWTMAVFEGSQVPVDAELYLQPSEGRLRLEVEVANDNALHWKEGLNKANIRTAEQRTEKYKVMAQLREVGRRFNNGTLTAADVANAIEGTLYIPE